MNEGAERKDLSNLLLQKRAQNDAIVAARDLRVRELFAVASIGYGQAYDGLANTDAPLPPQALDDFLRANDILQDNQDGTKRKLNEQTIPQRPILPLDVIRVSLQTLGFGAPLNYPTKGDGWRRSSSPATNKRQKLSPATAPVAPSPPPTHTHTQKSKATTAPANPPVPTPQPAAAAETLASPVAKPPTLTEHTPTDTPLVENNAPENANPDSTQRKHAQVSFPPGTKGSPGSGSPTAEGGDAVLEVDTSKADQQSTSTRALEPARSADAASSPESTVPSANTPAVHDTSSTDTSPDYETSHFEEPAKADKDVEDDKDSASQHDTKEPTESAEDQLLRESSAAAATPNVAAGPAVEKELKVEDAVEDPQPSPKTVEPESAKSDVTKSAEIPDSREDSPERMHVDTAAQVPAATEAVPEETDSRPKTPAAPLTVATEPSSQGPQRAVTRVSSGAMRPKSVSEIVGGTPRQTAAERPAPLEEQENQLTPLTQTSQSPARSRPLSSGRKDRPKGAVSAVLFGKQPKRLDERSVEPSKETIHPSEDYYTPLFIQGFTRSSSWMQPFEKLLYQANKVVHTSEANLGIQDHQACKLLHRVYHLQHCDKWSLRQPKRFPEPTRQTTHWDVVVKEVKWMRTDFREERKWKRATASKLAQACADWAAATPEDRKEMQVSATIPPKHVDDIAMDATDDATDQATPELISGDASSPQVAEELTEVFHETVSPSQIFTLADDDVVFGLRKTPAAFQLLDELPMYGPPLKVPQVDPITPQSDPDAHWRRPALPLSKYVEGPMKLITHVVPEVKSSFAYSNEESEEEVESYVSEDGSHTTLPPPTDEVALFRPEMKHIRDRLHAGHQFRPPTDHQMPLQNFYENRFPSMWTTAEDDELRSQVRQYSYNWPLIASLLGTKSMHASGAERRTPWECFERWIQLEGLPSDMQKTTYFKTYSGRIDAASRIIAQQQMAQQNATGQPVRRRPTVPFRVERRRNNKHLTLLDAMRKLAKKREAQLAKQQQATAQNAATKKPTDPVLNKPGKTPSDFSRERWERDQRLAEKMAQIVSQKDANRRNVMQARQQGQAVQGQAPGTPGPQPAQNGQLPNTNGANGQPRPNTGNRAPQARMPMQVLQNGMQPGPQQQQMLQAQIQSQQAHMQQQMQGQQRMPMQGLQPQQGQPDPSMIMQAQRISQQQRQAVQMQHGQQPPLSQQQQQQLQQQQQQGGGTPRPPSAQTQQGSPPPLNGVNGMNGVNMNGLNHQAYLQNNQAALAAYQQAAANGHASPSPNMYINSAASPGPRPMQMTSGAAQLQQQFATLEAHYKAKNPKWTNEQARNQAMQHLQTAMARSNAMQAAAGHNNNANNNGQQPQQAPHPGNIPGGATTSPHQYAAMLRLHQQQQAAAQAQQGQPPQHQQTPNASSPSGQSSSHHRQSSEGVTPGGGAVAQT